MESSPKHPSGPAEPEKPATPEAFPPASVAPPTAPETPRTAPGTPSPAPSGPTVPEQRTAPGAATPAVTPPAGRTRPASAGWSRKRLVLAVLGGVLALLCLGAAGLTLLVYEDATEPNRSAPSVATDGYLRALLVEKNRIRADELTCESASGLVSLRTFAEEIQEREKSLGISVSINIEDMRTEAEDEDSASVLVSIRRTAVVDGVQQSIVDRWRVELKEEGGWRVCGAERLPG